jgi:hypothetical protein
VSACARAGLAAAGFAVGAGIAASGLGARKGRRQAEALYLHHPAKGINVKDSSILKLLEFRILRSAGGKWRRCISTWRHGHGGGPVPPCSKALAAQAPAARQRPPWRCHPAASLVQGARRRPPYLSCQALSPCPSVSHSLLSLPPSWQAVPSARPSRDAGSPPRADGGWRSRRGAFECK